MLFFAACAFALIQPIVIPFNQPTTIPGINPHTPAPDLAIPFQGPDGVPIDLPNVRFIPGPTLTPTTIPGFTPSTFPVSDSAAVVIGTCVAGCVARLQAEAAAKGFNGFLTCLASCPKAASARQAIVIARPILVCLNVVDQAGCDACFFSVRCDNILSLPQAVIDALFNGECLCIPTLQTGCPNCNRSKKGLLGLLGLLGLIPLLLCLLLLCLCMIRRRKRQQDVHFATFDPAAANLAMPASHMAPCGPAPCF